MAWVIQHVKLGTPCHPKFTQRVDKERNVPGPFERDIKAYSRHLACSSNEEVNHKISKNSGD